MQSIYLKLMEEGKQEAPLHEHGLVQVDPGHEPDEGDEAEAEGEECEVVLVEPPHSAGHRHALQLEVRLLARLLNLHIHQGLLRLLLLFLDSRQRLGDNRHG